MRRVALRFYMQSIPPLDAMSKTKSVSMTKSVRVLLVEDSKVLTERLTEAIDQIADVHLIGYRGKQKPRRLPSSRANLWT